MKFTIGADPEVFLFNGQEIISAEGKIGGTKYNPIWVQGFGLQEDNIMAEIAIPPSNDIKTFTSRVTKSLSIIRNQIKKHNLTIAKTASSYINPKFLQTEQSKTFGCDPDNDVWQKQINTPPDANIKIRTCGGHIHIGYNNPTIDKNEQIVKAMDMFLGVPSVILDTDDERRKYYGKAGCFRFKEYGIEYRTLSNFWIFSKSLIQWVYKNSTKAFNYKKEVPDMVVKIINTNDKQKAINFIKEYKISLPKK